MKPPLRKRESGKESSIMGDDVPKRFPESTANLELVSNV